MTCPLVHAQKLRSEGACFDVAHGDKRPLRDELFDLKLHAITVDQLAPNGLGPLERALP